MERRRFVKNYFWRNIIYLVAAACVGIDYGNLVHPYECNRYITCSNERANVVNCAKGLYYIPKLDRSEEPENYPCKINY